MFLSWFPNVYQYSSLRLLLLLRGTSKYCHFHWYWNTPYSLDDTRYQCSGWQCWMISAVDAIIIVCLSPPSPLHSPHNWYADRGQSWAQPRQPQAAANNHQPLTFRCRAQPLSGTITKPINIHGDKAKKKPINNIFSKPRANFLSFV